jgi:hypothetical protein
MAAEQGQGTERREQPGEPTAEGQAAATQGAAAPRPPTSERAAARTGEGSIAERLDGMRGWLGDLDRTVGVRSRIGLVLAAVAIGGAGAATYLALNAKEQSASDRDVKALQDRLNSVQDDAKSTANDVTALRSSVNAARSQSSRANATASKLQSQVRKLQADVKDLQRSASSAAATPTLPGVPSGTGTTTTTTPSGGGSAGGGTGGG